MTSEIAQLDIDDPRKLRVKCDVVDLLYFYKTGVGQPQDIVAKMRFVIETYCTFTFPGFFDSDDTLSSIAEKIRRAGEQHPACALLDEIDEIHAYSRDYCRNDDSADAAPEALDINVLKRFVWRTLKVVDTNIQPFASN